MLQVTPSDRGGGQISQTVQDGGGPNGTYVETPENNSAWSSVTDDHFKRGSNNKSLSKSKRVKNYLHKKCKDVANTLGSYSESTVSKHSESAHSSWYVDNDTDIVLDDGSFVFKQNMAIEEVINDELQEEVEEMIDKFSEDVKINIQKVENVT